MDSGTIPVQGLRGLLIDGEAAAELNALDRGLHYGDGVFETLCVHDDEPRLWARHMARLRDGCERLHLPPVDFIKLRAEAARLCRGQGSGVLKLIITRGAGGRGYTPSEDGQSTRILALYDRPAYPRAWWSEGVEVRICRTRLGLNPTLAGMKHLNRLEQVMARLERQGPNIAEGLMQDIEGYVIEGTMSNIFIGRGSTLVTPALTRCGVAGVMRGLILDVCAEIEIACEVKPLTLKDVLNADEVFLCNALIGVWPVRRIDTRDIALGILTRRVSERVRPPFVT